MQSPIMRYFIIINLLSIAASASAGTRLSVCILSDAVKNNPTYHFTPTSTSRLKCEHLPANRIATLKGLYSKGWTLKQLVQIDPRLSGNKFVSPVLYMEHSTSPSSKTSTKKKITPKPKKEDSSFSNLFFN